MNSSEGYLLSAWRMVVFFLSLTVFSGCMVLPIKNAIHPGDKVQVDYTCRIPDGEIIITTKDVSEFSETDEIFRYIFTKQTPEPEQVTAGKGFTGKLDGRLKHFEDEVNGLISEKLPGKSFEKNLRMKLTSQAPEGLSHDDRYLKLTKIRKFPKLKTIPKSLFTKQLNQDPEPGLLIEGRGPYTLKVVSVDETGVTVAFELEEGMTIDHPHGTGVVHETENGYDIVLDVSEGQLIRLGALLGHISDVGEKMFTIDYGNPLGGKELSCEVVAHQVRPTEGLHADSAANGKKP